MTIKDSEMQRWIECRFQGLTKDQLIEAGEVMNCTFDRRSSEATMRHKLCEKLAIDSGQEPEAAAVIVPSSRVASIFDPKPNLLPGARWGGKRHNLMVFQPSQESEQSSRYFQLTWEGWKLNFSYGIKLSMPHPHFEVLKGSIRRIITQQTKRDEQGFQIGVDNIETELPRFNYQYIGIEPGTENLPESLSDYWKCQAAKHNNFKTKDGKPMNRRILQAIRTDLYGPVGSAFYKDLTDEDILYDVLNFLHGDRAEEALAA